MLAKKKKGYDTGVKFGAASMHTYSSEKLFGQTILYLRISLETCIVKRISTSAQNYILKK